MYTIVDCFLHWWVLQLFFLEFLEFNVICLLSSRCWYHLQIHLRRETRSVETKETWDSHREETETVSTLIALFNTGLQTNLHQTLSLAFSESSSKSSFRAPSQSSLETIQKHTQKPSQSDRLRDSLRDLQETLSGTLWERDSEWVPCYRQSLKWRNLALAVETLVCWGCEGGRSLLVGAWHRGREGHRQGGREGGQGGPAARLQLLDVVAQLGCCLGREGWGRLSGG